MGKCQICNTRSPLISAQLGICLNCIRLKPEKALQKSSQIHAETRQAFNLPAKPPQTPNGIQCGQCANKCKIAEGQKGYCGLVENQEGKLRRHGGTREKGILQWYYDPLPTNCVSWWFCPGCTGAGYPKYAYKPKAEIGYSNLAVFYGSCSTDCLFCQNWHYRNLAQKRKPTISAQQLASKVNGKTSCICFFGGDPSTQMPHALKTSQTALREASDKNKILRICWETNGRMLPNYAQQAAELSLKSGGNMKFDLKTWNENLNKVLCGTSNKATLENFQKIGKKYYNQRPELPILTASTLLIPGYVDTQEVEGIAKFIAEISPQIPYTLLAFYPAYILNDLPTTSRKHAHNCYITAKKHLNNVRIGNIHLLS
ncbi:radical SAM protein [Candidatus Bathyarchaeota archaeon]|nr:radical SAM protein [Candidatus Bathyarchaeota archaeon]